MGSLYFSEVAHFDPCRLCWYQRIAMYPLAVILGIAAVRRDTGIRVYGMALAAIGAVIASYHVALEWIPALDTGACGLGPSCSVVWFRTFGFISLPTLALIAFLSILALLALVSTDPDDGGDLRAHRRTESHDQTQPSPAPRRRPRAASTNTSSRWLLPVAAVVLLGVGGLAWFLGQAGSGAAPTSAPSSRRSPGLIVGGVVAGPPVITGTPLPAFTSPTDDPAKGMAAPVVHGHDDQGAPVSIEPTGRVQMVIFAAHWCPHCQREIPLIQAWVDGGGLPDDVDIVTVSTGIEPTAPNYPPEAWFEREGWTAPVMVDETGSVAEAYGLATIRTSCSSMRTVTSSRASSARSRWTTWNDPRDGAADLGGHDAERGLEALQERDLGRFDPAARLGGIEPVDPVDLGERHRPARLRRPLHLERVRPCDAGSRSPSTAQAWTTLPPFWTIEPSSTMGPRVPDGRSPRRTRAERPSSSGSSPSGSPLGIDQVPASRFAKNGPPGCARSTSRPAPVRR